MITFIIPTIGRSTLQRAIDSIKSQSDPDWKAIIVFDGIDPTITETDHRIKIMKIDKKGKGINNASFVRIEGIKCANTEWIGFLDDDDIISTEYVSSLKIEKENYDVVIFKMIFSNDSILPLHGSTDFKINEVGISYCLKRSTFTDDNIWPNPSNTEDFDHLNELRSNGKKIKMSDKINYLVKPKAEGC
jgi:glycosyltransferase involved in cell wall biosynthesis